VAAKGQYMLARLRELEQAGLVTEVRGMGLMLAIDLPRPLAAEVVSRALEHRIILNSIAAGTIRFLPPLIVEERMIDQVVEFLTTTLKVMM
jgi:acetylornithine/succinyldiaminopimelate/putrescine aminotransferase